MSGVEKIEINLTEDQGAASVCEVRKTSGDINFQFLGVGNGNILQPQLAQRVECNVCICPSILHEELKVTT